jgi:hypothetical protein
LWQATRTLDSTTGVQSLERRHSRDASGARAVLRSMSASAGCRVLVAPVARCTKKVCRGPQAQQPGIPCTVVVKPSFVLPVATVVRKSRQNLARTSRRQDHTTSPSARTPFVFRHGPTHPEPNVSDKSIRPSIKRAARATDFGKKESERFLQTGQPKSTHGALRKPCEIKMYAQRYRGWRPARVS